MKVFRGIDNLPEFTLPVVTTGSFDGLHTGHRVLLSKVAQQAAEIGGESVVVTFSPHPRQVLGGAEVFGLLTSLPEKIMLLEKMGIDNLIVVDFTPQFSRLSYDDFVRGTLVDKIGVKTLVVGYDHHFGYAKQGNFDHLDRLGNRLGFSVEKVPQYSLSDRKVSSTGIRNLIGRGSMRQAAVWLGYNYLIMGETRHADCTIDSNGAMEFVPADRDKLIPAQGIYEVEIGENSLTATATIDSLGRIWITTPDHLSGPVDIVGFPEDVTP